MLSEELAAGIDERLCASNTGAAELIVLSRVIGAIPDLANPKGLDCVFSRHPQEDAVLWSALDAWGQTNLPKSAALAAIERTATDPRTLDRLGSREERLQRRNAATREESEASASASAEQN